jgi:hypothetical protein
MFTHTHGSLFSVLEYTITCERDQHWQTCRKLWIEFTYLEALLWQLNMPEDLKRNTNTWTPWRFVEVTTHSIIWRTLTFQHQHMRRFTSEHYRRSTLKHQHLHQRLFQKHQHTTGMDTKLASGGTRKQPTPFGMDLNSHQVGIVFGWYPQTIGWLP